jgi:predicted membrane protein
MKFETVTKIILAILFFLCLFDMPYGFYQLVRFLALIGFVLLAFKSYGRQENEMLIMYCGLALLFQPFFKIALGREIWNIVDVVVGLALITSIWVPLKFEQKK